MGLPKSKKVPPPPILSLDVWKEVITISRLVATPPYSALFASCQTGYRILGLWVSQRAQRTNKLDSVGVGISCSRAGVPLSWLVCARFVCLLH